MCNCRNASHMREICTNRCDAHTNHTAKQPTVNNSFANKFKYHFTLLHRLPSFSVMSRMRLFAINFEYTSYWLHCSVNWFALCCAFHYLMAICRFVVTDTGVRKLLIRIDSRPSLEFLVKWSEELNVNGSGGEILNSHWINWFIFRALNRDTLTAHHSLFVHSFVRSFVHNVSPIEICMTQVKRNNKFEMHKWEWNFKYF